MIDKEKFEERKCLCPNFTCNFTCDDDDGHYSLDTSRCHFDNCPIVFWVNVNEERN